MSRNPVHRARRAATLADVGREAGVSAMAASAVLNGTRSSARISEQTRERILAAAKKLSYRANAAARALANQRMNTLGVTAVIDGGELNHYFLEVFNGIIEAAASRHQNTTVFALPSWDDALSAIERSCDGRIDGMILVAPLVGPTFATALPKHLPFVSLHANTALTGTTNLESAEEAGAQAMIKALLELGHRRIMHVSGPRGLVGAERRIRGYERALAEAGLTRAPQWLVTSAFNNSAGHDVMRRWLKDHSVAERPTAIFCASDAIATGCMEALVEAGIRVPEEISVAGFDDTIAARTTHPPLSTVRQPLRAMGREAVQVLLARIEGPGGEASFPPADPVVFPTEVVLRPSVAPPPTSR